MVHLIAFELVGIRLPTETARLADGIRSFGDSFAVRDGVWIVESESTNKQISEKLVTLMRPNDRLIVTRMHKDWVSANFKETENTWLSRRNYFSINDD